MGHFPWLMWCCDILAIFCGWEGHAAPFIGPHLLRTSTCSTSLAARGRADWISNWSLGHQNDDRWLSQMWHVNYMMLSGYCSMDAPCCSMAAPMLLCHDMFGIWPLMYWHCGAIVVAWSRVGLGYDGCNANIYETLAQYPNMTVPLIWDKISAPIICLICCNIFCAPVFVMVCWL